jgi:imidazolonepropionase
MGMVREALRLGAVSVDHLESSTTADLEYVASSPCVAVLLPACGFHADGSFANARALVGAGGAVAVATNCNPGSAPTSSMPLALAISVRRCGLSPAEAIVAGTINPASVLGLSDRGTIAPGQRADLLLLRHRNERELTFEFGGNPVDLVICAGRVACVNDETSRLRAGV